MRKDRPSFRREASLRVFRRWLATCEQPLLITSTPYSGKTFFVNQLQNEPECVGVHFCRAEVPESLETATVLRSLASQLVARFPNVVLPSLCQWTLLSECVGAVEHLLGLPLASLPPPPKPLFLVIDNLQPLLYELILALEASLPVWLRCVVTARPLRTSDEQKFSSFHIFDLAGEPEELRSFIATKLPQCSFEDVYDACVESWFYVDQLGEAYEQGMLSYECLPFGTEELLHEITQVLPQRFTIYLMLVKAARHPPTHQQLIAVSQFIIRDLISNIQRDIEEMSLLFSSKDPYVLAGSWADFVGDLAVYHTAWAELFKVKKGKTPEDVVELAYHLAHSEVAPSDSIRILSSLGAGDFLLVCDVIDIPTTNLLVHAGASLQDHSQKDDFVFRCSCGDLRKVTQTIERATEKELSLGLLAAASRGHVAICKRILEMRPQSGHFVSESQWNALRSAACNNHLPVLDLLIDQGINVDDCGNGGRTALRAAAWSGHREIVCRLLRAKTDVEKKDSEGRTALMAAAFMDHAEIVEDLLNYGANIKQLDASGATALHLTLSNGAKSPNHDRTIAVLLQGSAPVNHSDSNGRLCLHLAAYHGDRNLPKIAELTGNIDAQDENGRTPLMLAASHGQLEAANQLVERKTNIDVVDNEGRTALMHAAIHNHLPIVDLLLSLGADEGHKDNDGAVALHYAVLHGNVALVRALCTNTTLRSTDRNGAHPLIIAAQQSNVEVIKELLNSGAPANLQTWDGLTALRAAANANQIEIVEALAPQIEDWEQLDLYGTPLVHNLLMQSQNAMVELLLRLGTPMGVRDAHARTVAHVVGATNDVLGAKMLNRLGISFEVGDMAGRTPLHTAIWAGHLLVATYFLEQICVDPNAIDHQGASALSIASQLGNRDLVVLLLKFGAEPNQRDKMGRSCLDVARLSGHEHIRSLLKSACGSADSSGFGSMPNSPAGERRRAPPQTTFLYHTASPRVHLK
ncbi:unnamed protein product, partial [Mesorhabditis belari]|uniref:Ankyrin repeat domain-containing protein 50 n=1 Tax=Mesorhabditis belari TaxID=2138241 RepID=A0AAF3J1C0_9BILA